MHACRSTLEDPTGAGAGAGAGPGAADGGAATGSASTDTRPGGGLGNPVDPGATNDPWAKYRWWILGGLGLVLAAGAGVMLRRPSAGDRQAGGGVGPARGLPESSGSVVLSALKEELFTLETERLQGAISETEYAEHKQALERVLRRALGRGTPLVTPSADAARAEKPEVAADLLARSGMDR